MVHVQTGYILAECHSRHGTCASRHLRPHFCHTSHLLCRGDVQLLPVRGDQTKIGFLRSKGVLNHSYCAATSHLRSALHTTPCFRLQSQISTSASAQPPASNISFERVGWSALVSALACIRMPVCKHDARTSQHTRVPRYCWARGGACAHGMISALGADGALCVQYDSWSQQCRVASWSGTAGTCVHHPLRSAARAARVRARE